MRATREIPIIAVRLGGGALALMIAAGPGCSGSTPETAGEGGGHQGSQASSSSSSAMSSSSGGQPECLTPLDCSPAKMCATPTCEDGTCGLIFTPEGTPATNEPFGDCQTVICDGLGGETFIPDDDDYPDDGVECTADACSEGKPVFTPKPTNTFCGTEGTKFCHADTTCNACKEVSAACEDTGLGEPNEDQASAFYFGVISDSDGSGKSVCGVLAGASDADWYTYNGYDQFLSVVDPYREVFADQSTRLCVYFECDSGSPVYSCPAGSVDDTAPLGQPGCCSSDALFVGFDCSDTDDDDAQVWLRVDNPDGHACVPYQLSFHY